MSEEQLKAFLEAVKADNGLQEKLKGATDSDSVMAIAKEAGFMISADELQLAQAAREELTDEELERVSGGASMWGLLCPVKLALSVVIVGDDNKKGLWDVCVAD